MPKYVVVIHTRSDNVIAGPPKELTSEEYAKAKDLFENKLTYVTVEDGEGGHFIVQGSDISFIQLKKAD